MTQPKDRPTIAPNQFVPSIHISDAQLFINNLSLYRNQETERGSIPECPYEQRYTALSKLRKTYMELRKIPLTKISDERMDQVVELLLETYETNWKELKLYQGKRKRVRGLHVTRDTLFRASIIMGKVLKMINEHTLYEYNK